jgi:hypothetical protein
MQTKGLEIYLLFSHIIVQTLHEYYGLAKPHFIKLKYNISKQHNVCVTAN